MTVPSTTGASQSLGTWTCFKPCTAVLSVPGPRTLLGWAHVKGHSEFWAEPKVMAWL